MRKTLMKVRDLTIGHNGTSLFTGISFDICEGDLTLLCGANGSGKTTLLKALTHESAEVKAAMIPTRIPKVKGFTLNEFVQLSCYDSAGADPKEALDHLALSHLADRDISTLSDGEFQKGTIAAAIAKGARIILLDEPTAFLDAENRRSVLSALRKLCDKTGTAVIFSSHDLHESLKTCNKVIALGADRQCRISDSDMDAIVSAIFSKD
jgi:iron complex transport system ATP-binding protein